jgi:hypothetical protein
MAEKYVVSYRTGATPTQHTRAEVEKQFPEINFNLFEHFNLEFIVLQQKGILANSITIQRGPDHCYRCQCPDLTYADETWGCDQCGQLQ